MCHTVVLSCVCIVCSCCVLNAFNIIMLQSLSEQTSLNDVYSVVDKSKKKNSAGAIEVHKVSTRPVRKHDYEEIDDDNLPPVVAPYHSEVVTNTGSPVKKTVAQHSQSLAITVDSSR